MKDRRGFTLIEIMIVIAIVGIVGIIATTNFFSWQSHYSSVGFQREFLSQVNDARTRSMGTSLQHRLLIDMTAETVTLQRGTSGTGSSVWTNVGQTVVGSRGAGIARLDNCSVVGPIVALLFNPDGEVLSQDITAGSPPNALTLGNVRIAATSAADQSTIQIYGWTSKARVINGWN
jgi:prepilin-type N-terminal cleavage/methylation domain-containing protein